MLVPGLLPMVQNRLPFGGHQGSVCSGVFWGKCWDEGTVTAVCRMKKEERVDTKGQEAGIGGEKAVIEVPVGAEWFLQGGRGVDAMAAWAGVGLYSEGE